MRSTPRPRCAVVALGGNALSPPGEAGTIAAQFRHTRESLGGIVDLLQRGFNLAITHGNGPQVGAALRRVELAGSELPPVPLGVLVADTEGSMGYMIEQSLQNRLAREGINRQVMTVITQVIVSRDDPALAEPTKFIGQIYDETAAGSFIREEGWTMKPYGNGGKWRRVVGSPLPLAIVNRRALRELVQSGVVVIAAGGGGIPVYRDPELGLEGIDAVVDKDRAAAVLATDIEADELIIVTNVKCVSLNYGTDRSEPLAIMRIGEARRHMASGQFPPGSMGPKVEAAIQFVERGGERAIICALGEIQKALAGRCGTEIVP
ncbi:MAG: carbamate kinase [Calditrichaeota bacterium]|nr:carbamate kinase [Calditrichota bacterium]